MARRFLRSSLAALAAVLVLAGGAQAAGGNDAFAGGTARQQASVTLMLSGIAGVPVDCVAHGSRYLYEERRIELRDDLCALLAVPKTAQRSWLGVAVFVFAHEMAHADQHREMVPFDELDADCRAARAFGRTAYAVGVRGSSRMQFMVSVVRLAVGYNARETVARGCWEGWR